MCVIMSALYFSAVYSTAQNQKEIRENPKETHKSLKIETTLILNQRKTEKPQPTNIVGIKNRRVGKTFTAHWTISGMWNRQIPFSHRGVDEVLGGSFRSP